MSAIVVSYRTGPALWDCIASVLDAPQVAELVLVDNGNPAPVAGRLRALAAAEPRVKLVQGHGNIGFAAAANLGAAAASGAYLLFLNPDASLKPGAVDALRDAAAAGASPCIVGGMLLDADGNEARGARRGRVTPWSALVSFTGLWRLERWSARFADVQRTRAPVPEAPAPVGAVSGAFMMAPRRDFEALGGFDRGYFLHVEDIDICHRAAERGGAVLIQPRARAYHAGSTSDAPAAVVARHKARGFARYFRKQARGPGGRLLAAAIGAALLVLLPLRAWLAQGRR